MTFFTDTLQPHKLLTRYIVHSTKTPYTEVIKTHDAYEYAVDSSSNFEACSYDEMTVGRLKKT